MQNKSKFYVTKWAVAHGIQVVEGKRVSTNPDMIEWRAKGWSHWAHKGEWFDNERDARADAERRVERKRQSLLKQIKKLDNPVKLEDQTCDG